MQSFSVELSQMHGNGSTGKMSPKKIGISCYYAFLSAFFWYI
jgi:hypothetical protein